MEFIERLPLVKLHYLLSLSFKEYKPLDKSSSKNDDERKDNYNKMRNICESFIKANGTIKRLYKFTGDNNWSESGEGTGRLFAVGNGIQGLPKKIRGFLLDGITSDIDMVNAHPVILRYLCRIHNLPHKELDFYIENRDDILSQFPDRDAAKTLFLKATNDDTLNKKEKNLVFKAYDKEMKSTQKLITQLTCYKNIVSEVPSNKLYNWSGSAMNRILCFYENKILQVIISELNKKKFEICAPMFDGVMPYELINEDFLIETQRIINETFSSLDMRLSLKEHAKDIVMPEDFKIPEKPTEQLPDNIANDDMECAKYIIKLLDNKLKYTSGTIFYKNGNIWTNDIILIENMLTTFIMENSPLRMTMFGLKTGYTNLSSVKPVIKTIFAYISQAEDPTLYNKFHSTTKGRIAFKDGVLCSLTNKFYLWSEINFEYYTTICINREFNNYLLNPDFALMEQIKSTIFEPLFGKDCELALKFISRALMGHTEDKNWATYVGNRNCGKGVIYELMKHACESYVGSFKIDNILVQREGNGKETAKDLYWLMELEFMRLAISQETPSDSDKYKISGALLKKIASGGDTQIARRNYDRKDTHFVTDATLFSFGNNDLECSTTDCNEHRFQFKSIIQFKKEEQINELKKFDLPQDIIDDHFGIIDFNLKQNCQSVEWSNAFILLIMRYYKSQPLCVVQVSNIDNEGEMPLICKIFEKYEITKDVKDIILSSEIESELKSDKKKLTLELEALGVTKKKYKGGNKECRDKVCYFGIKKKIELVDEIDDEM